MCSIQQLCAAVHIREDDIILYNIVQEQTIQKFSEHNKNDTILIYNILLNQSHVRGNIYKKRSESFIQASCFTDG